MTFQNPYKTTYQVTQGFALNFNPYYKSKKQLGHTGIDLVVSHLAPIYSVIDCYCYSHINKDNKDLNRYRAVFTLVEDAGVWYEISYGHLMGIFAKPKTYLKAGDLIGEQGNTGAVFVGGKAPTKEQKEKGAGSHLHLQVRLVTPVTTRTKGRVYLRDAEGLLKYQGKFWEVVNYDNGFNGCIPPEQFFNQKKTLITTLRYGDRGEQVKLLQKKLDIPTDGIFGLKTMQAVKAFQTKHKLLADGVVGQLTRNVINQI